MELVILAMERSETEADTDDISNSHWFWLHLSSQLIYFVLFQFATFPNIVMALHDKVKLLCSISITSTEILKQYYCICLSCIRFWYLMNQVIKCKKLCFTSEVTLY